MISLIWAMDKNRLIGNGLKLPWRLPADLAFFKQKTFGKPIIMGRKTYESIGKPLPGRKNIILSRNPSYHPEGTYTAANVSEAVKLADYDEAFVIGGAEIYSLFLPVAGRLYITRIHAEFTGDIYFPNYPESDWILIESIPGIRDEKNPLDYEWNIYERKNKSGIPE